MKNANASMLSQLLAAQSMSETLVNFKDSVGRIFLPLSKFLPITSGHILVIKTIIIDRFLNLLNLPNTLMN